MIRPLDMQVAINTLPEHARQTQAEHASVLYRQNQEMGRARIENLARQERLSEAAARSGTLFRGVDPKYEDNKSARTGGRYRVTERDRYEQSDGLYAPLGGRIFRKATREEQNGTYLDLTG